MGQKKFKKIVAVLGGGGLRGLAHVGVLKALKELDLFPHEFCGTSVGSLIAAVAASNLPIEQIEEVGLQVTKNNILDFNLTGVLTKGSSVSNLHTNRPYKKFIKEVLPYHRFEDLPSPLFVNTVNVNTGSHVVWGMNSLTRVTVPTAVLASCSIPGVFPPVKIGRHWYVDGAVANNLLLRIGRARQADLVIAVNLKNLGSFRDLPQVHSDSFLNIMDRADNITSQQVFNANLDRARDIPFILVQPDVVHRNIFDFNNLDQVIKAGYDATFDVVPDHPLLQGKSTVPHKPFYQVDLEKCGSCGMCELHCEGDLWKLVKNKKTDRIQAQYDAKRRKYCGGSMTCLRNCPYEAISLVEEGEKS